MKKHSTEILDSLIKRYPLLSSIKSSISEAIIILKESIENGGTILICGNGGSAADSEHIVGELMKGFMSKRELSPQEKLPFIKNGNSDIADKLQGTIPAISLVSQSGIITAFANDIDPDLIFAQQVYGYRNINSVVLAISTSGNSKNIINAVRTAKSLGMKSVSLLGGTGGELSKISSVSIIVPNSSTPLIQELHLPVYHAICAILEAEFFQL